MKLARHQVRNIAMAAVSLLCIVFSGYAGYLIFQPEKRDPIPIGGPFALEDSRGQPVTDKDFLDRYLFVYFGYTFCPDICPTELFEMTEALDLLADKDADKASLVDPVFITVDPDRDTPEVLAEYVGHFHPRFRGLTGPMDAIMEAVKAYRGYVQKQPSDDPDAYLVDHTTYIYLMGPDGYYLTHFTVQDTPHIMAERLDQLVR